MIHKTIVQAMRQTQTIKSKLTHKFIKCSFKSFLNGL